MMKTAILVDGGFYRKRNLSRQIIDEKDPESAKSS